LYKPQKYYTPEQLIIKAQHFCAYRERCHDEVYSRLMEWGAYPSLADELISDLIVSGFLNEERFARIYSGSKFRQKKWGKNKIKNELQKRNISPYCISKGMEEIEDDEYLKTLKIWVEKKNEDYKLIPQILRSGKIATYCIQKGFEPDLVWETIKREIT